MAKYTRGPLKIKLPSLRCQSLRIVIARPVIARALFATKQPGGRSDWPLDSRSIFGYVLPMRYARLTYAVILSGAAAWCALLLVAPAAASVPANLRRLGALLYGLFSPLCHQIDARSFHLCGEPLAVCGRCSAIYFGFLSGTIIYPFATEFAPRGEPRQNVPSHRGHSRCFSMSRSKLRASMSRQTPFMR